MNELLKQFNEDMKLKLDVALSSKEFESVVKATKEADGGTFTVIISTENQDRQGEVVKQDGLNTDIFMTNPVVLWAHDYSSLPIGVATRIYKKDGQTMADGKFAPAEANPFAQQVRKLYDGGFVRATSVGFIPTEMGEKGVITKAELLEFSFVPVPANPYALSLRTIKEFSLDLNALAMKGLTFQIKADEEKKEEKASDPEEGDACSLEDGTEGVITLVDGELKCIAKKAAEKAEMAADEATETVADELAEHEANEAKWDRLSEFYELVDAFVCAFMDENKTMADWDALMAEFIELCKNVPMNEEDENEDGTRKSIVKSFGEVAAKAGRQISGSNAEILNKCAKMLAKAVGDHDTMHTEAMKPYNEITAALSDMLQKAGSWEDDETTDGQKSDNKKRSISAGYPKAKIEKEAILETKDILREVQTALQESLTKLNAKTREHYKSINQ